MGSSNQPISPTTQILTKGQAQVASATGTATFTFESPPAGSTWSGTLSIPGANSGSVFTVMIGGTGWGSFGGNSVYGPVQVLGAGSQQMVVSGTGLNPGQSYEIWFIGSSDASANVAPIWPDANSTALTAQISGLVTTTVVNTVQTNGTVTNQVSTNNGGVDNLLFVTGISAFPYNASGTLTFTAFKNYAGFNLTFSYFGAGTPTYIQLWNSTQNLWYQINNPNPTYTFLAGSSSGQTWYLPIQANAGDVLYVTIAGSGATTAQLEVYGTVAPQSYPVSVAPNTSFDVVEYGGLLAASSSFTSGTNKQLLAAPTTGYAYRIHALFINGSQQATTGGSATLFSPSGTTLGSMVITNTAGGTTSGTLAGYSYLGGQLALGAVSVTATVGLVTTIPVGITYDIVARPAII